MAPDRRGRIWRAASRTSRKEPRTLTPMTRSKSASVVSKTGPPSPSTPAQATATSTGPSFCCGGGEGIHDGLLVAGIALEGERPAAELLDAPGRLGRRSGRPVQQGEIGAEIGQGERRLQPDARAAAGDEGRLALEGEAGEGRALAHVFFPMLPLWVGAPPPGTMRRQSLPA